ncbi:hypothetical protein APHAL10511_008737 [Amanita phalloides]|nr:hypothetical protein APHAL10511_008737 [Amanita phalloides]
MRIITWNINGIRTLPQYYPWCTFKAFDEVLNHLQADIICFQETKTSRSALQKDVAIPESYHSFFSFPMRKTGYSGVAIYTRLDTVIPIKAEEGLSGLLQPKQPLTTSQRVSSIYPPSLDEGLDPDLNFLELDSEGRALTIDLGLFVLINVYCPNDGTGTEERDKFKMDFHRLLELRVRGLVEEGREVMVVGDINACAAVIDHCEGSLMVARGQAAGMGGEEGFWERESRRWLRDWLVHEDEEKNTSGGLMVDIVRRFWPDRKGMYTCWNTKISARESNYGTRIDYILITKGLVPWIKAADVQQQIKGSDHCPVFTDLHEKITNPDGSITRLRDVIGVREPNALPPSLAAKFWDEYSGKQTRLHTFFTKKAEKPVPDAPPEVSQPPALFDDITETAFQAPPELGQSTTSSGDQLSQGVIDSPIQTASPSPVSSISPSLPIVTTTSLQVIPTTSNTTSDPTINRPPKRKVLSETPLEKVKKPKGKKAQKSESNGVIGQTKLSSFFAKPKLATEQGSQTLVADTPSADSASGMGKEKEDTVSTSCPVDVINLDDFPDDFSPVSFKVSDLGIEESLRPSAHTTPVFKTANQRQKNGNGNGNGKDAWSAILAPTPIPRCIVHNEPAKEFTVNKQGPNKGKRFFICSRPVGPGYDKGRAERLREEVDPQYRCNFFKWSSEARKESRRLGGP